MNNGPRVVLVICSRGPIVVVVLVLRIRAAGETNSMDFWELILDMHFNFRPRIVSNIRSAVVIPSFLWPQAASLLIILPDERHAGNRNSIRRAILNKNSSFPPNFGYYAN